MLSDNFNEQFNAYLEEAGISRENTGSALGIIERFFDSIENDDSLSDMAENGMLSNINLIPSQFETTCHELLVVLCNDSTDFYLRALQALNHCIRCRNTTKAVVLATHYWNSSEFEKWCQEIFLHISETYNLPIFLVTSFMDRQIAEFPVIRKNKKKK